MHIGTMRQIILITHAQVIMMLQTGKTVPPTAESTIIMEFACIPFKYL